MTQAMRLPRSRRTRLVAASSAAVIVWSLAAAAQAQDLPTNPVIVNSSGGVGTAADFTFGSNLLTIDQNHDRVVIDWDDFNIGALDTVTFNQPDAGAIAFNRVDPTTFTTIDGTLNANGGVWLFSPGGLLFGSGAVVNVGSFVGTTARLADVDIADALATNAVTLSPIPIPNGADLTVSAGASIDAASGFVVLLGETVVQNGTIVSDNDAVWFGVAQGGEITFTSPGAGQAPDLADGTVAAVTDQQPYMIQGPSGSTTAATWFGVSTPSTTATGWSTLINLGGTIEASGIKPSTDSGVWIITGDDGVYDLTAVDTTVDSTGGLITANNGDVFIRTGQAILQDVYAEDIDVFTGGDLTLTGAIQATSDIVIGSDTLVSIESTAALDADQYVTITTTYAGADVIVDGSVYAYQDIVIVADDLLEVNGTVEGVYGVDLWGIDVTTTAGSSVTSLSDIYINAENVIDLSGDISGDNVAAVADVDIIQRAGTITVESRFDAYAGGEFNTSAGALITSAVGYDAIVDVIANGDISLAGDVTAYDVIFAGHGDMIEVSGLLSGSERVSIYNDSGDIHLTSTAEIYAGPPVYETYPVVYIGASGSIVTDAGSYIHTAPGYPGAYVNMHSNGPTGTFDLSGDITSANIYIGSRNGDVDVILRDGDLVATEYVFVVSSGDLTTGATTTITTDGAVYVEADNNIDLSGDISGNYVSVVAGGDIHQLAGTITVQNGGFYSYSAYDTITDAGAVITNEAGSNNAVIEIFAGYDLDLGGAIHGYEVFLDSVGPMILISGSIYASDFIFVYNDTGSLHLTGTADLQAGVPVASSFSSIYLGAYGSVRVDAGAQITAGVGQPGSYVSLFANGPTGYLDMSGDIASGGIYMGSRSGDVDVYVGGSLQADGDIFVVATGDLTTGAASSMIAGDYLYLSGDASVGLSGDLYAYEATIYSDGDVTQSAGTITVDDGGLYVYALNDIVTEAGALIETTIDGNQGIIYLNAGHDLYLAGDIDGGYFVTINSVGIGNDTILEVSGSIYATDFIILYNDYGDIHLTGTAELHAGQPTTFGEPGIWIAAEGSIVTDAGSYIHTYPGYADGYVHFEVNDVTGSIDLSGDITTENLTIEAPFGVVDIFLRDGVINTTYDLTIDSNGQLLLDATIYADNFYLSADDQLSVGGVLNATGDVTLNSDTGVAVTAGGQIFGYDISIGTPGVTDIDGAIYGQNITVGGYDGIYVSGTLDASGEVNIISLYGDVAIENGAYIRGYSFGTAVYVQADGDLAVENGADIISYGDLMLVGGTVDFDGYAYAANFNVQSSGDLDIGVNGEVLTPGVIHLLSEDGPPVAADITIAGSLTGEDGIYIANRNDGDVVVTADAEVIAAYFMGLRLGPRGQTSLGGMDGDIYIYSAGSVVTDYGSLIDATGGVGSDQGLLTIVAAGTDGPSATPAAIDLSGDIVAWNVDMTATAGSIRQRTGQITVADYFTADAELNFIQDGGGVIEGLSGLDRAYIDIDANNNILLLGLISGYYVDLTTTGTVPGSEIQLAGEVYASDGITITNLDGDILVHSTGVIHTGDPFDAPSPDILMVANGVITTQAGSQIYTDPNYSAYSTITLQSTLASGLGIDLAGDIATAGYVDIVTTVNADIQITGGTIQAGQDVDVRSQNQIDITGGLIEAGDTVLIRADADILLGGDIYADYIDAATYGGESGGVYGSVIRVEGQLTALTDIDITNQVGGVEIGAGAVLNGNYSGQPDIGAPAVDIFGYSILTEAGSLITVGPAGGPTVGDIVITAYANFAGPGPAIDLSGDIEADALYFNVGAYNDMRVRDGDISTLGALDIVTDGYFIVDDPANFFVGGDFSALSYGGMDIDGDIFADRIALTDDSGSGLAVGGGLLAIEDIRLEALQGDVHIGGYAFIRADTDGVTSIGEYNGIVISAYDQVIADPGSRLYSGPIGAPTGDVSITAQGLDSGGFAAIDLASDITAADLILATAYGSIRLRDGDITLTDDLTITSPQAFVMDGPATIVTDGYVDITAVGVLTVAGTIDSGGDIALASTGLPGGPVTVNGYLYADGAIDISLSDPGATIILGGPTIIADADNSGGDGSVSIVSAGTVLAPGGGLIQVGDGSGQPTGDVSITANGFDWPSPQPSAIDLNIDINAQTLDLYAPNGSIHLVGGDIYVTDDLVIDSVVDFVMEEPAAITGLADVAISAASDLYAGGTITAGGDVSLHLGDPLGYTYFTAGPGDMVVSGDVTANGSVSITSGEGGADIYFDPTANVLANADDLGTGDEVYISAYQQVITAAGSTIAVGTTPSTSGDVTILAGGTDNASYSAIDLSGDIDALSLQLQTAYGSIHLADGTIEVAYDLTIDSNFDVVMDAPARIYGQGNVDLIADRDLVVNGQVYAEGGISLLVNAGGDQLVVGGQVVADGDVDLHNLAGDILIDGGSITADADFQGGDGDIVIQAQGQVVVTAGSTLMVGPYSAPTGDVVIEAFGADSANYSAIDLSGDITAVNVTIDADDGSVNLAAGAIEAAGDVYVEADDDIIQDQAASIDAGGDVYFGANRALTVAGSIHADGDVDLLIDAPYSGLLTIDTVVAAGGDIDVVNQGGDVLLGAQATLFSNGDILLSAYGDLTTGGFIDSAGLLTADAGGDMTFDADVQAGYGVILIAGDDMAIGGYLIAEGYNDIFAEAGGTVTLTGTGHLLGGDDVRLYAGGDLVLDGRIDNLGLLYGASAGDIDVSGVVQSGQVDLYADGAIDLSGDLTAANGDLVARAGQSMDVSGDLSALADIDLLAGAGMAIDGQVIALDDVYLTVQGSGDILIGGDVIGQGDVRIDNQANYGDVRLYDGADLVADINGDGGDDALLSIYAEGRIIADAGSNMHVGSAVERTGLILLGSYAYDGEGGAAIQLAGDIDAQAVEIWADYGSVHVQGGAIHADESIEIYAYDDFILDDGALIWGAQERVYQDDVSTETTLPGLLLPGVLITASDVDISGDIQSGDADDDATIVIAALNVDGDVTLGGADNGLGTGFTLSDAEFDNLVANRIVLLAGTGPDAPDLIVSDLSIDAANTADVWLGTTGTVFVEGAVTPSQPGAVDLHIGFTVLTQGINVIDLTALSPGQILVDFIPTDVHISGSLGDVANPFGHVTLVANGDILMGSSAFMAAAENDPEFDAFEESENFDSPGEGHVFIAADLLQMAATGEILQQDTVEGPGFGGLVLGQPQAGYELIFSPDDIEGQPIGFGTEQWTANFNAGPTRIELFGQFNGTPHAVTGTEAARLDHLLDPDILLGDYEFNTCLFGGTQCQTGNDTPPFQNPTPPVHPDPSVIPGVDEVASFFTTFPFAEPDEEEEEERIEGEPVTGSGNEDLWPVTTQGGTRP